MTNKKLISITLILTLLLHLPSVARAQVLDASQFTNACSRTLGFGHTCTVKADGTVACWGNKDHTSTATSLATLNKHGALMKGRYDQEIN